MEAFVNSSFFIFVTGWAEILIAIFLVVILALAIKIVADLRYIVSLVRKEADELAGDLRDIKKNIKVSSEKTLSVIEGLAGATLLKKILSSFGGGNKKKKRKTKSKKSSRLTVKSEK